MTIPLEEISEAAPDLFLCWSEKGFYLSKRKPKDRARNREMLFHLFGKCVEKVQLAGCPSQQADSFVRKIWTEEGPNTIPWSFPSVVGEDGFLRLFAKGRPLNVAAFRKIWQGLKRTDFSNHFPTFIFGENKDAGSYYNVKATPRGFLAKFSSRIRLKRDPGLLKEIQSDLHRVSQIEEYQKRKFLTLAILSCAASYRELDGEVLQIPSLVAKEAGSVVSYGFRHHLIWEGIKTVSATPLEHEEVEPGLYLCQGTEFWPSQPAPLGTIYANLGKEGSATEPYARCWRQIHSHLRALTKHENLPPLVAGHSMGGALASQILLYSHPLIDSAYAFNPPVVEERDFKLYHRLSVKTREKLHVYANVDDLPFWRIGSNVIGKVTLFLGQDRWPYRPVRKRDLFLLFPAAYKIIANIHNVLPSHQNIFALQRFYIQVPLSAREIKKENGERCARFDRLNFIPKFHKLARWLLGFFRNNFRWKTRHEYLQSQIELLELHEKDLRDTLAFEGGEEIARELEELKRQKQELLNQ